MSEKDNGKPPRPRWIGGAILIFLGIVFLLQNAGLMSRDGNWWAVFIFIPAFVLLSRAYAGYRAGGKQANSRTLVQGILGVFFAALAVILLLDIDLNVEWDYIWPVILILIGVSLLLGRRDAA